MFTDAATQLTTPGAIGVIPTDTVYGVVAARLTLRPCSGCTP